MTRQHLTAWVEGLLIKPQHFEQQERALHAHFTQSLAYTQPFLWGIDTLSVNQDLLAHGKLQFTALSGSFQDGTVFQCDATMLARLSLDINEPIANEILYLGLPMNDFVSETSEAEKRFILEEIQAVNTLTPTAPTTSILVRQLNLTLLRQQQQRDSYWCFPVLKIKKADPDTGITLDTHFIPATLNVHSNPHLTADLQAMVLLITRKQQQLANTLAAPLQTRIFTIPITIPTGVFTGGKYFI